MKDIKIILGIGSCQSYLSFEKKIAVIKDFLEEEHIAKLYAIATIDKFLNDKFFSYMACIFDTPCYFLSADLLEQQTAYILNPSDSLYNRIGCHSVAEAAAIALSKSKGIFIKHKTIRLPFTFALTKFI